MSYRPRRAARGGRGTQRLPARYRPGLFVGLDPPLDNKPGE